MPTWWRWWLRADAEAARPSVDQAAANQQPTCPGVPLGGGRIIESCTLLLAAGVSTNCIARERFHVTQRESRQPQGNQWMVEASSCREETSPEAFLSYPMHKPVAGLWPPIPSPAGTQSKWRSSESRDPQKVWQIPWLSPETDTVFRGVHTWLFACTGMPCYHGSQHCLAVRDTCTVGLLFA